MPRFLVFLFAPVPALCAYILERLNSVLDALFQRPELDAQHINHSAVVILVETVLGVVTARCAVRRKTLCRGVALLDDLCNLLVRKVAGRDEKPLVGCSIELCSLDVCERQIPDVNPNEGTCLRDLFLGLALVDVTNALVRSVECVERVQVVNLACVSTGSNAWRPNDLR